MQLLVTGAAGFIGHLLAAVGADWSSVVRVADRPGHGRRYSVDTTKIRTKLGYRPRVPFGQGLAETVRWYRENRRWWEAVKRPGCGLDINSC